MYFEKEYHVSFAYVLRSISTMFMIMCGFFMHHMLSLFLLFPLFPLFLFSFFFVVSFAPFSKHSLLLEPQSNVDDIIKNP